MFPPLVEQPVDFYTKEEILNLPVVMDVKSEAANKFGVPVYPTTFILNPEVKIVAKVAGMFKWDSDSVMAYLRKLASKKRPKTPAVTP